MPAPKITPQVQSEIVRAKWGQITALRQKAAKMLSERYEIPASDRKLLDKAAKALQDAEVRRYEAIGRLLQAREHVKANAAKALPPKLRRMVGVFLLPVPDALKDRSYEYRITDEDKDALTRATSPADLAVTAARIAGFALDGYGSAVYIRGNDEHGSGVHDAVQNAVSAVCLAANLDGDVAKRVDEFLKADPLALIDAD